MHRMKKKIGLHTFGDTTRIFFLYIEGISSSYQKMTVYLDFRKKYVTLQAVKEAE